MRAWRGLPRSLQTSRGKGSDAACTPEAVAACCAHSGGTSSSFIWVFQPLYTYTLGQTEFLCTLHVTGKQHNLGWCKQRAPKRQAAWLAV